MVKKEFKQFQDRKTLLSSHSHFLCDSRVASQLYNLLGKVFSNRNHLPVPVDIPGDKPSALEQAVQKAVHMSTYMHVAGQNITLRVAHCSMSQAQILDNVLQGASFAINKLVGEQGISGGRVHSIHIKTSDSAALPLFSRHYDRASELLLSAASQIINVKSEAKSIKKEGGNKSKKSNIKEETVSVSRSVDISDKSDRSIVEQTTKQKKPKKNVTIDATVVADDSVKKTPTKTKLSATSKVGIRPATPAAKKSAKK